VESIDTPLSKSVLKELRKRASQQGVPLESVAAEALLKGLEILDPPQEIEHYREIADHFFAEAQERLSRGDLIQASEKFWGAAAQMVKAVAAQREVELQSHGQLHRFVVDLSSQQNDSDMPQLFASANALHQNFYEHWLDIQTVQTYGQKVGELLEKLERLLL
jgi:hypothetical protein